MTMHNSELARQAADAQRIATDLIAKAQQPSAAMTDPRLAGLNLEKSTFTQAASATSGLTFYDLEIGAKTLYPVLTPLRNEIPRVSGKGGIQANWRAITGVNTTGVRLGVSAGNRGGVQAVTTQDYTAAYKGIGLESSTDFEAQYAGQNFDDVRAISARTLLESTMIGEEMLILGGNGSAFTLGQTPTPTVVASNAGGALAAATWTVICVALGFQGLVNGSVTGGIQQAITRTNAGPYSSSDTFGGGSAGKSAAATGITTGAVGSLTATVAAVNGAVGYAWFWGPAGAAVLGAITAINSISILAPAAGTQTAASLSTVDASQNNLEIDGLLSQAFKPGSNAYIVTQATGAAGVGSPLTADGSGGVIEIDNVLKYMWDTLRLSPQTIWVNSQQALDISRKILQGNSGSAQRFVFNSERDALGGGIMVRTYLNRFSMAGGSTLDIRVHPNMPAGTIFFHTRTLPYPLSNVTNVCQIRTRQDYYQIEWPLLRRAYEIGVYADEVLQVYFPPSLAIITNIGVG